MAYWVVFSCAFCSACARLIANIDLLSASASLRNARDCGFDAGGPGNCSLTHSDGGAAAPNPGMAAHIRFCVVRMK